MHIWIKNIDIDSMVYKMVFWNTKKQRIKFTLSHEFDNSADFDYVGLLTNVEFDLFVEALFIKFEDEAVSFEDVELMYSRLRSFCNDIKDITENI